MENAKLKLSIKCLFFSMSSILIDQITKTMAVSYASSPVKILNILNFSVTYNRGISFGVFAKYNLGFLLIAMSILLSGFLCYIMFRATNPFEKISYSFFIGGAVGTALDRCRYGHVIDFIDLHISSWHFPTFNVADILLSFSCAMLIILGFRQR